VHLTQLREPVTENDSTITNNLTWQYFPSVDQMQERWFLKLTNA